MTEIEPETKFDAMVRRADELYGAIYTQLGRPVDRKYMARYEELFSLINAVLELHGPNVPPGIPTHYLRDVEAHDEHGRPLGITVQVPGEPVPGWWCRQCNQAVPCPTVQAVAEKLGVKLDGDND